MAASASFTINASPTPVAVAAGAVVTLALVSVTGVRTVEWSIIGGSDDTKTAPVITPAGSPLGATAAFTMTTPVGPVGVSWVVRCRVNGGNDDEGSEDAALTSTGIVGVNNVHGYLPFSYGELHERSATHGIAPDFNAMLVIAGGGGEPMPSGTANGHTLRWLQASTEWVETGTLVVDDVTGLITASKSAIGTTTASGLVLHNPTAAAGTAPQYSPAFVLQGEAFASAARREIYARQQVRGAGAGSSADPTWVLSLGDAAEGTSADAASLTDRVSVSPTVMALLNGLALTVPDYVAIGASPAASGVLRVPGNSSVFARRSDAIDYEILTAGGDGVIIGSTGADFAEYRVGAGGTHSLKIDGVAELVVSATTVDAQDNNVVTTGWLAVGASPAPTGDIRLLNGGGGVRFNSNPGGTAIAGLRCDSANDIIVGETTTNPAIRLHANQAFHLTIGSTAVAGATANTFDVNSGVALRSLATAVNDATAAPHQFFKGRNGAAVQSADDVGVVQFLGLDGSNYLERARVSAVVSGAPSAGNVPMGLVLYTGSTSLIDRLHIEHDGAFFLRNVDAVPGTPSNGGRLYVENGELKWKGPSGAITSLGAA